MSRGTSSGLGGRSLYDHLKRFVMWAVSGVTILLIYGIAKLEPFGTAVELPLTSLDRAIPLVPESIWIYGSGTLMCLLAWLSVPDRWAARRLYFTITMSAVLCGVVFLVFPTTYPRHLWPLPPGDSSTLMEFRSLRSADTPSNCFPSQHVALAWALALCWCDWTKHRWFKPLILAWAVLVTLGTLTTKQHYLWDLPPGMLVGVVSWWAVRSQVRPRARHVALSLTRDRDRAVLTGLLGRVREHRWSLDDIEWPAGPLPLLPAEMARLLNQTIWIEEIAGLNFRLLQRASDDPELAELYGHFADDERRHANGLRRVLELHGHPIERPGLGPALVLDQFDTLQPDDPADVALVAMSTPVFETFLDAGTIPFLAAHEALNSPAFTALVERIDRDEGAHLATNWLVTREMARRTGGLSGLKLLLNPNVWRGAVAVPFLSLETYSLAHALGFDFRSLLPAFGRLWRLHRRFPELLRSPLWWTYRLFVVCGSIATVVASGLSRAGVIVIGFWVWLTRVTDRLAWALFGPELLDKRLS